jgi:hypothetical protein
VLSPQSRSIMGPRLIGTLHTLLEYQANPTRTSNRTSLGEICMPAHAIPKDTMKDLCGCPTTSHRGDVAVLDLCLWTRASWLRSPRHTSFHAAHLSPSWHNVKHCNASRTSARASIASTRGLWFATTVKPGSRKLFWILSLREFGR